VAFDSNTADVRFDEFKFVIVFLRDDFEDLARAAQHFGPYAITGKPGYLRFHESL